MHIVCCELEYRVLHRLSYPHSIGIEVMLLPWSYYLWLGKSNMKEIRKNTLLILSVESSSSSILSPSTSLCKTFSSKIDFLQEKSYLPNSEKGSITDLPLVNPYLAQNKSRHSFTKIVLSLISPSKSQIKEFVQTTKFDQHLLSATKKK